MPKRLLISWYNKTTQFPQKGLKMVSCQTKNRVFLLFANFLKLYHHLYFHYLPKRQLGLYIRDSFTFAIIPLNDCFQPFLTNLVAHYSLSKSTKERGSTDELRIWDHLSRVPIYSQLVCPHRSSRYLPQID